MTGRPLVTGYAWSPDEGGGHVRDTRVRWALEEVGQPYDMRNLDWGEQKEPDHRSRNPFGQVPTYEEGDLTLFESGAIVLHIALTRPGLLPDDADARARAIQWMFAALNTVEPPITDIVIAKYVEGNERWAHDRLPLVEGRIRERLAELTAALGKADWLDGEFSAGDLLMIAVLRNVGGSPLFADFPALQAYVARGEQRPAFQRALASLRADQTGNPPSQFARKSVREPQGEDA